MPIPDLSKPRYDQSGYRGRALHFFATTNPLNVLKTSSELEHAKHIYEEHQAGQKTGLSEEELWGIKQVYDSAFHPKTGEKMFLPGRMAFQVPANMFITGCMLNFYKSTPEILFWQWFNQTFNAIVNVTNSAGGNDMSKSHLASVYALATSGAVITALSVNQLAKKLPPLFGRFGPFTAVAAANCINIPCMRSNELKHGIVLTDTQGNEIGHSVVAAKKAIREVVTSRILMAMPGMVLPPLLMNYLEQRGVLGRYPRIGAPLQIFLCGLILTFATPMCCALFPQHSAFPFHRLEAHVQEGIKAKCEDGKTPEFVYFNKGL